RSSLKLKSFCGYTAPADAQTAEDFTVARKRGVAQEALWRIVYDHDYQPVENTPLTREVTDGQGALLRVEPRFVVPWTPADGSGWSVAPDNRRAFVFDGQSGGLRFDPDANPTKYPLTDWMAYDVTVNQSAAEGASARPPFDTFARGGYDPVQHPLHNVSDIKLHLYYTRQTGDGALVLRTTKLDHAFSVEILPGRARMHMSVGDAEPVLIGEASIPDVRRPMRIELVNADYRVSLSIDGREVLATNDEQYRPDIPWLIETELRGVERPKPRIAIEARDQTCRIEHLSIWRDVYYSWRTMRPIRAVN
ncbi:MAG TPA: hypothetical protein PKB10_15000, partial [Tepidisphaeraceae bacterium]|nr:hypothetical protein [Tepidisphaeraceae bacterium]